MMDLITKFYYQISILLFTVNIGNSQINIIQNGQERKLNTISSICDEKSKKLYTLNLWNYDEKLIVKEWNGSAWRELVDDGNTFKFGDLSGGLFSKILRVDNQGNLYLFLINKSNVYIRKWDGKTWSNINHNISELINSKQKTEDNKTDFVVDNNGNYFISLYNRIFTCDNNKLWKEIFIEKNVINGCLFNLFTKDANGNIYLVVNCNMAKSNIENNFTFLSNGDVFKEDLSTPNISNHIIFKWNGTKFDFISKINKRYNNENSLNDPTAKPIIELSKLSQIIVNNENSIYIYFEDIYNKKGLYIFKWDGIKWNNLFDFGVLKIENCYFFLKDEILYMITNGKNKQKYVLFSWEGEKLNQTYEFPLLPSIEFVKRFNYDGTNKIYLEGFDNNERNIIAEYKFL